MLIRTKNKIWAKNVLKNKNVSKSVKTEKK